MSAQIHWLASYPKSGNTWLRLVLSQLKRPTAGAADFNDIEGGPNAAERSWLDTICGFPTADLLPEEVAALRPEVYRWSAQQAASGRTHKIHDACWRTASGAWLPCAEASGPSIYVLRNPLDVALSYAHHSSWPLDTAIAHMGSPGHTLSSQKRGETRLQVEQKLLSWSQHVESWIDNAEFDLLVLKYEDMLADPHTSFAKAARHIGWPSGKEEIAAAVASARFDRLERQENDTSFQEKVAGPQKFFRKGIAGDWQENMLDHQIETIISDHRAVMERFGYCDSDGKARLK